MGYISLILYHHFVNFTIYWPNWTQHAYLYHHSKGINWVKCKKIMEGIWPFTSTKEEGGGILFLVGLGFCHHFWILHRKRSRVKNVAKTWVSRSPHPHNSGAVVGVIYVKGLQPLLFVGGEATQNIASPPVFQNLHNWYVVPILQMVLECPDPYNSFAIVEQVPDAPMLAPMPE